MKLSVTTLGTKGTISPEGLMPKLKAWGYDGIELWGGDLPGAEHVQWYQEDNVRISDIYKGDKASAQEIDKVIALKALATKNGLAVPMIAPYFDFLQGKQRWEESIVVGQRYIQYAQAMGVKLIRAMTGGYGSGFKPGEGRRHAAGTELPSASMTDAQWQAVSSGLKALVRLPGADQVVFALETHRGRPEDSISSLLREVKEANSPSIKILLQPNQFIPTIPGMTAEKMLDALYPHTVHIHIRTPMEKSPVGWATLLPELKRRGYDGYISLEGIEEPKLESIENEVKWFHKVLA